MNPYKGDKPMVHPSQVEILQLRGRKHEGLLDRFYRSLYRPAFPIANERENVATWKELLWGDDDTCQLHVLLAGTGLRGPTPRIVAGHVFEYYPQSRCGLLTYLVVRRTSRRQGVGRRLFTLAVAILKKTARRNGTRLRAIFAEVNDPGKVRPGEDVMPPRERLRFFEQLGGAILELPYVQPELEPGQGPGRKLLLLQMHPPVQGVTTIQASPVFEFLEEFYRAEEILDRDVDLRRMLRASQNGRIRIRGLRR